MENREITRGLVDEASAKMSTDGRALIAEGIISSGIDAASRRHEAVSRMEPIFSDELETMDITNQKKSGRCWIFAGMNVMRYAIAKKYRIKNADFELSQSYMMFWDKLEKANYFLESVIGTASEEKSGRTVMWLFDTLLGDGGQWDMLVSLIEKYGMVPKYAMRESFHSGNSARMNALLKRKLRRDGVSLRGMYYKGCAESELRREKAGMMGEFYRMLCSFLGEPPRTFDFTYRDKDGNFHRDAGLTPLEFYHKYWGADYLGRFISVINAPTDDKPFSRLYTVKYLGNVVEGKPVTYLNLPSGELERMARAQISDGEPVWFGSDVGKYFDRETGILDTGLFDYEGALGAKLDMSKADMLDYGESCLTHAMMLVGFDRNADKTNKWKVENSWGGDVGKDGFFTMSDDWFGEYVCQVVVDRKYLTPEQLAALDGKPIQLEPWDPIGSLAD